MPSQKKKEVLGSVSYGETSSRYGHYNTVQSEWQQPKRCKKHQNVANRAKCHKSNRYEAELSSRFAQEVLRMTCPDPFDLTQDVTDAYCDGKHECDVCMAYVYCSDREPIEPCALCGTKLIASELYGGVCDDCIYENINARNVIDYCVDGSNGGDFLLTVLLEDYFSDPGDSFGIYKLSKRARRYLCGEILNAYILDQRNGWQLGARRKLCDFICETDDSKSDFGYWLKKKVKQS